MTKRIGKPLALILSLLFLSSTPLFATLSALDQSLSELRAIIQSDEIPTNLPTSQTIESISSTSNGYLIQTQEYELMVEVKYHQQTRPGPVQYELIFHQPTRKKI